MISDPYCPKCGELIMTDECIDTYGINDNEIAHFCVGECPKCGTHYEWEEIYRFNRIDNLCEN